MKSSRRKFLHLAAGAAMLPASLATVEVAAAQDWPTRPLTMVVAFAAGSSIDVLARILAPRMSELLGQQVVIENVSGAAGMIGTARVAKAMPDGYQFVLGGTGPFAQNQTLYKNLPYNAAADFTPVALLAETPPVLLTRKDLPAQNLSEFIAYAMANQAKMQYGSSGGGTATHLACALLNAAIGINVTHIPYRGGGPAMQDLIAGRIDYQCPLSAVAIPQIEGKTVNAIAVLTKNRSASMPALASAHEQGLVDFAAAGWYGFFLPKGAPAPIVQKLHEATLATLKTPSVQVRLRDNGFDLVAPERRSPDYLQKFVEGESEKWAVAIKAAGVSAD
jgi:tripartite-type tricarboxylate transporter receptor subunit TctC